MGKSSDTQAIEFDNDNEWVTITPAYKDTVINAVRESTQSNVLYILTLLDQQKYDPQSIDSIFHPQMLWLLQIVSGGSIASSIQQNQITYRIKKSALDRAIVALKLRGPVGHVEESFDGETPEGITT